MPSRSFFCSFVGWVEFERFVEQLERFFPAFLVDSKTGVFLVSDGQNLVLGNIEKGFCFGELHASFLGFFDGHVQEGHGSFVVLGRNVGTRLPVSMNGFARQVGIGDACHAIEGGFFQLLAGAQVVGVEFQNPLVQADGLVVLRRVIFVVGLLEQVLRCWGGLIFLRWFRQVCFCTSGLLV